MLPQYADALLEAYLLAADPTESQQLLTRLLSEFAEPIIKNIINSKLHTNLNHAPSSHYVYDVEDVYANIHVQLLARVGSLKTNFHDNAIRDFRGYVSAIAYNACNEYLRRKYPQRYSLKNKIRYVLSHDKNFTVQGDDEHQLICSLAVWTRHAVDLNGTRRFRELRENPQAFIEKNLSGVKVPLMQLPDLLRVIFRSVNVPMRLDDLVAVVAALWEIKDRPIETSEIDALSTESAFSVDANFAARVEQREYLQHLWQEIGQLPPRQRAALLLNLKDAEGRDMIALFPLTRTASIREIAAAVDIPLEQFAQLWRELPLDDAAIAKRLGATRQQVINLRKAARKRLVRRQMNSP